MIEKIMINKLKAILYQNKIKMNTLNVFFEKLTININYTSNGEVFRVVSFRQHNPNPIATPRLISFIFSLATVLIRLRNFAFGYNWTIFSKDRKGSSLNTHR